MAIKRQQPRSRAQIGFYQFQPPTEAVQALSLRGYQASEVTSEDLKDPVKLSLLAAVIFAQKPLKMQEVASDLRRHADQLLNFGCRIIVKTADPQPPSEGQMAVDPMGLVTKTVEELKLPAANLPPDILKRAYWQELEPLPPCPRVDLFGPHVGWDQIANDLANNDIPVTMNTNLGITVAKKSRPLRANEVPLVQRAFADSLEVHLVQMNDGRSGVAVYRAYPERLAGPNLPLPHPLPHFIKIGKRKKILAEYDNYEIGVDPYIPFHLGPHLDKDRCCLSAHKGIMVGDYVEGSESLDVCVRAGRAAPTIACLFDTTLHAWYRAAKRKDDTSVPLELRSKIPNSNEYHPRRLEHANKLGSTKSPLELHQLLDAVPKGAVLIGVIHGDLRAQNIRVRGSEAIIIDFLAQRTGPIVFDMASLEASLVISSCFLPKWRPAAWLASILPLYNQRPFDISPPHASPKDAFAPFHETVRQIRHHAQRYECGQNQYASALAIALLIKASKDVNVSKPENSARAIAYLLAEKILMNI